MSRVFPCLLLVLAPIAAVAQTGQFGCPGPAPQFEELLTPQDLQSCINQTCGQSNTPSAASGYPINAQETTLSVDNPLDVDATHVWLQAEYKESGLWKFLWAYRSTPLMPVPPGQPAIVGAPGLMPLTEHRFRASFCAGSYCTCWSLGGDSLTTPDLTTNAPGEIVTGAEELEEQFVRPVTAVGPTGDGLGPDAVWIDNGARIVDGIDADSIGERAELVQAGTATNQAVSADTHSYTDVLVRGGRGGSYQIGDDEYNIDVFTKQLIEGQTLKAYYVKLAFDPQVAGGDRALLLGRLNGNREEFHTTKLKDITAQPKCPTTSPLPLEDEDPGDSSISNAVWLRVEVRDQPGPPDQVFVAGTVAWGCQGTDAIEDCDFVCTTGEQEDTSINKITGVLGKSGFCSHHKTHLFGYFQAGSTP